MTAIATLGFSPGTIANVVLLGFGAVGSGATWTDISGVSTAWADQSVAVTSWSAASGVATTWSPVTPASPSWSTESQVSTTWTAIPPVE